MLLRLYGGFLGGGHGDFVFGPHDLDHELRKCRLHAYPSFRILHDHIDDDRLASVVCDIGFAGHDGFVIDIDSMKEIESALQRDISLSVGINRRACSHVAKGHENSSVDEVSCVCEPGARFRLDDGAAFLKLDEGHGVEALDVVDVVVRSLIDIIFHEMLLSYLGYGFYLGIIYLFFSSCLSKTISNLLFLTRNAANFKKGDGHGF